MTAAHTTLPAAISEFQQSHADLHARYVGRPFDDAYRREIERMESELDAAVRSAPPVTDHRDALVLIDLEIMLFKEHEGEAPEGIHRTRLAGLEAVRAFLQFAG
jgi:hypothetical protein